jgi:hypothetical protein
MDIRYILIICVILIIIYKSKINNYSLFSLNISQFSKENSGKNASGLSASGLSASEKNASEKNASEKNASEKNASEKNASEKNASEKNALCFITREYNELLFEFAETCTLDYDVYIVIDDNSTIIPSKNNVTIIQMDKQVCLDNHFIKSTYRFGQDVTGWDKAFYYFSNSVNYNHVWFLEDDVYLGNSKILKNIDSKYGNIDMLCEGKGNVKITNEFPPNDFILPNKFRQALKMDVYQSMVCAVRISKNVLDLLKLTAIKNKRLYFHEVLLLSLVKHNKLSYLGIHELEYIKYRYEWKYSIIKLNQSKLFHPIKDLNIHKKLRQHFSHLLL